jgi:ABC-type Fe3+-citrate transport system substrate-binding protein
MFRPMAALVTVALLAVGAAACGDDDETTGSSANSKPAPVAKIDALSGQKTEVTLDSGFVDALGTLKLTPAPLGDGKITKAGVARFPITGGNVTHYEPGSVSPTSRARLTTMEAA